MSDIDIDSMQHAWQRWWDYEGSAMRPHPSEDTEQFARRMTEIAWANGALVAERDALRKRVAELEALSKPVYISHGQRVESIDLRERLVCAALTGLNSNSDLTERDSDLPQWAINQADQVLAAMRKGVARE